MSDGIDTTLLIGIAWALGMALIFCGMCAFIGWVVKRWVK